MFTLKKINSSFLMAGFLTLASTPVLAAPAVTVPIAFSAGDTIIADDMNANFSAIADGINNIVLMPGPQGEQGIPGAPASTLVTDALDTRITTNTNGVTGNAKAITGNAKGVSVNTNGVAVNANGVAKNTSIIKTTANNVVVNTKAIAGNTNGVAVNAKGVAGNTTIIKNIANNVVVNAKAIAGNTSGVVANANAITTLTVNGSNQGDMRYWDVKNQAWLIIPAPVTPTTEPTLHFCNSGIPTWDACSYQIGDTGPGGGIVFSVSADGLSGLEASQADLASISWGCDGVTIPTVQLNNTDLGTGAQNSANILAAACADDGVNAGAAIAAENYATSSFDWYLPSLTELSLLVANLNLPGDYWSSSDIDSANASSYTQSSGAASTLKANPLSVRAIRAFPDKPLPRFSR